MSPIDTITAFGSAIILALIVLALMWHSASTSHMLWVATRRAERAEDACETLRKQVMRGSTVVHLARNSTNSQADHDIEVVVIADEPHAFTDSVLPRARQLYTHLVDSGQIKPLNRQ